MEERSATDAVIAPEDGALIELQPLLEQIERDEIDPSFVITSRLPIEEATSGDKTFRDKPDGCLNIVRNADSAVTHFHLLIAPRSPVTIGRHDRTSKA
jgi:hypothetical protein